MDIGELPGWYLPPDGYLWDPWFFPVGSTIHVFYLFQPAPGSMPRDAIFARDKPTIAHATWSRDEGWVHKGTAIDYTGQPYDAERIHTGCVVERDGSFYMLYSGSNRFVCLAQSGDLDTWAKVPQNPVASPDPDIYLEHWRGSLPLKALLQTTTQLSWLRSGTKMVVPWVPSPWHIRPI